MRKSTTNNNLPKIDILHPELDFYDAGRLDAAEEDVLFCGSVVVAGDAVDVVEKAAIRLVGCLECCISSDEMLPFDNLSIGALSMSKWRW